MRCLSSKSPAVVAGFSAIAFSLVSSLGHAQTQEGDPSETSIDVVQFSGAMHATSLKCGAYFEQKLLDYKREQQEKMTQDGMDPEDFEQAFAKGRDQAEQRWKELSKQEQEQACQEIENQVSDMTPPSE